MRTSLSCEYCRRSKIKCLNNGHAPCRKCERSGNPDCALTRTPTKTKADGASGRRVSRPSRSSAARRSITSDVASETPTPAGTAADTTRGDTTLRDTTLADTTTAPADVGIPSRRPSNSIPPSPDIDTHLASLPLGTILRALNTFTNKVPELRILHPTVFAREYGGHRSRDAKALLAAVLAVVKTLSPAPDASALLPAARYVAYAQDALLASILLPPKVHVVQGLLILAFHEWGTRDFHRAWVHCGIAIRIMQSLHSSRVAPYPLDVSQQPAPAAAAEADDPRGLSAAVEARTYWACFIMDCTINSGLYTPRMLTMAEMRKLRVSRPLSTVEFAFGTPPGPETTDDPPPEPRPLDPSQSFEMLVGGFDIYAQVMAFIFDDGRRAPGMCAPSQCPWVPGSLWDTCRARLERWRAGQHATLHYPENSVAVHMTLGYGESFVYLNLLYYMCRIMLQREYSPFLPTPEMTPRGPVDPPMLEAEAPPGWWDDGARELFASGEHIASLLHDAAQCGVSVCTPFTGFCAFTACFLNLYVTHFPNMNLGRSRTSRVSLDRGNQYLREFKGVWALGDGWVKTVKNASVLFERATSDRQRYRNKSRFDFDVLHQSIHEFRIVDRSEQHMQQINRAETQPASPEDDRGADAQGPAVEGVLAGLEDVLDDQMPGMWPNWWSTLEDVDLSGAFTGG